MKLVKAILLFVLIGTQMSFAQDDLNIFGYFQGYYNHYSKYDVHYPINPFLNGGNPEGTSKSEARSSFLSQQLNLFFVKDFSGNWGEFTSFVNFEITSQYSSDKSWGAFNLEEAWVKYSYNTAFNAKIGAIIPTFNNLNEIKNRTPLLPYIFRPFVYEANVPELISFEDFIPENAFLQIYGFTSLNENINLNYAFYLGNSESSYYTSEPVGIINPGTDSSKFKMVGGRLGVSSTEFKVGISGTYDRDNQMEIFNDPLLGSANPSGIVLPNMDGNLPRIRMGADFSFNYNNFVFEAEYISVNYSITDAQKNYFASYKDNLQTALVSVGGQAAQLQGEIAADPTNPLNAVKALQLVELSSFADELGARVQDKIFLGKEFDKYTYYAMLGYNVTDSFMPYVMFSAIQDKFDYRLSGDAFTYSVGATWRPIYSVSVKGQYLNQKVDNIGFDINAFMFGVSVYF